MNKRMTCLYILLIVFLIPISVSAEDRSCNDVGALRVCIDNLTVNPTANGQYVGDVTGSLEITNKGDAPLRIAMMQRLSVKLDNGHALHLEKFSGLASCLNKSLGACERDSDEFEVIAPGEEILINCVFKTDRVTPPKDVKGVKYANMSGSIFMRNLNTNKSMNKNISIKDISVKFN